MPHVWNLSVKVGDEEGELKFRHLVSTFQQDPYVDHVVTTITEGVSHLAVYFLPGHMAPHSQPLWNLDKIYHLPKTERRSWASRLLHGIFD